MWTKGGERIFQKVLQEELQEQHWELHHNVFVFKAGSAESSLIYLIFLNERKMTAIKHPYDDSKGKCRQPYLNDV